MAVKHGSIVGLSALDCRSDFDIRAELITCIMEECGTYDSYISAVLDAVNC